MLNQPIFESCFKKVRIAQKFEILAIVVFFGKHLLWAALLRAHISTHWRIFLWCCVCCIKGFISTVCSLSWKNIENCQNIEEQKVFSKTYFGTNWIINAKRKISVVKTCLCPFSGPMIGLVLESLKSAHRLHLQCMDWKSNNFA